MFVCLLEWWAGNCSITESLPELIQQVRQNLAGALWRPGLMASRLETTRSLECQPPTYESACTRFITDTLEQRRQKLCLRFAIKNINSSNCMFTKPNENINLRRKNKIVKEYKCNKTKFQRSSLPYLAKLANSKA